METGAKLSSKLSQKFRDMRSFIDKHRLASIIIASSVGIAAIANIGYMLASRPVAPYIPDIAVKPKAKVYYSALTGLPVASASALKMPVTSIIIENSLEARPQSGIKNAEVVYEAIAEGGITRFEAFYQQNKPSLIGPVRSVRPYYIDWAVPYQPSFVHVGGSAAALKEIRNGKYRDLDQFFNDQAYWRASDRYAPHNVYTSFSRIDALNKQKGYKSSNPKAFERSDKPTTSTAAAKKVNVHISGPLFDSEYRYDAKSKLYTRYQAGGVHKDREKGAITPKVIIVMSTNTSIQRQDTEREVIQTTGKGSVKIFQNGKAVSGTWNRPSRSAQFTFTDKNGEQIMLARGQTWFTAIPTGQGSVKWQ